MVSVGANILWLVHKLFAYSLRTTAQCTDLALHSPFSAGKAVSWLASWATSLLFIFLTRNPPDRHETFCLRYWTEDLVVPFCLYFWARVLLILSSLILWGILLHLTNVSKGCIDFFAILLILCVKICRVNKLLAFILLMWRQKISCSFTTWCSASFACTADLNVASKLGMSSALSKK